MGSLIVCSSCGQHVRADEHVCPHCTSGIRTTSGTVAKTASAMLLGLAIAGCPSSDDDDNASSDTMDVQPLYGEPDPSTTGAPDPEESSSSTTGEPEDESSTGSESSSTTGDVGESEYGTATTGGG